MFGKKTLRGWRALVSLLLVAVLVPVQAAGCCKLAAVAGALSWTGTPDPSGAPKSEGIPAPSGPHACCRGKKADAGTSAAPGGNAAVAGENLPKPGLDAGAPAEHADGDCVAGSRGCCLKDAPHADPGLVSAESGPSLPSPVLQRLPREPLPVSPGLPALAPPAASGPPVFLACRRLLI